MDVLASERLTMTSHRYTTERKGGMTDGGLTGGGMIAFAVGGRNGCASDSDVVASVRIWCGAKRKREKRKEKREKQHTWVPFPSK